MQREDIDFLLGQTKHPDANVRREAVRELCPCELKFNSEVAWDRLLEMASDEDVRVRRNGLHVLCDGSPRSREGEVVQAIEVMQTDPDQKLRRQVRNLLAGYKRTGKINVL